MRLQLIANPVAGRGAAELIHQARQCLLDSGAEVELFLTRGRGDAERYAGLAASGGFDRVVAAGGDGTVNEVVNGLSAEAPPLAVLPLGTTNVLALEIGLPSRLEEVCFVALRGIPTPIHLGLADQRRFVLMAGLGFDAAVVHGVDLRLKKRFGKAAYLVSTWRSWLKPANRRLTMVDADGHSRQGYGAILGNARFYGGRFTMTPGASLFADSLEVCLVRRPGRFALLMAGLALLTGRLLPPPWGEHFQSRQLTVSGDGIPVQLDGDEAGFLPRTFAMHPWPIQLMMPHHGQRL